MTNDIVRYKTAEGEPIELTKASVAQYMVSGNARGVTDAEFVRFMQLCKANRLNPFLNEAYLVKYGDSPATIVPGKEVFTKRAYRNERFRGMEAGVTVLSNGHLVQRPGCMTLQGESLVGGWCKVYVEGYSVPIYEEVPLSEYTTGKSSWKRMPGTMIRKVAMCHALREAFPEDLGGLYDSAEMGVDDAAMPQPAPVQAAEFAAVEPASAPVAAPAPQPKGDALRDAYKRMGDAIEAWAAASGADAARVKDGVKKRPDWAARRLDVAYIVDIAEEFERDVESARKAPNPTETDPNSPETFSELLPNDIEF